ncbi:MAG: hypothetical protein U9Q22_05645 [Candidatus Altiarchaeota archaeon]|nr:hypothetical protein [Candidatus Altiarchaeota archaeon]
MVKTGASYYRESEFDFSDLPPWAQVLIALIILGVLTWIFVIQPFIDWAERNMLTIIIIFASIVILLIVGFIFYLKYKTKKETEKQAYEEEQKAKGLVRFIDRFGNEKWGKPNEVDEWKKGDDKAGEKEKLVNQIVDEIENFKASQRYFYELPYQAELIGYLKSKFQNTYIEKQEGSSRPDIVIGDVAIEVKGPTRVKDLKTIADKCMRYCQHFRELIIVLFEVDVYDQMYEEWEKGIKNTFPKTRIIRK